MQNILILYIGLIRATTVRNKNNKYKPCNRIINESKTVCLVKLYKLLYSNLTILWKIHSYNKISLFKCNYWNLITIFFFCESLDKFY